MSLSRLSILWAWLKSWGRSFRFSFSRARLFFHPGPDRVFDPGAWLESMAEPYSGRDSRRSCFSFCSGSSCPGRGLFLFRFVVLFLGLVCPVEACCCSVLASCSLCLSGREAWSCFCFSGGFCRRPFSLRLFFGLVSLFFLFYYPFVPVGRIDCFWLSCCCFPTVYSQNQGSFGRRGPGISFEGFPVLFDRLGSWPCDNLSCPDIKRHLLRFFSSPGRPPDSIFGLPKIF